MLFFLESPGFTSPYSTATTATSASSSRQPRLDLHTLQKALQSYYHQGLAAYTQKTYPAGVQHFVTTFIIHCFQLLSKHFCCLSHIWDSLPMSCLTRPSRFTYPQLTFTLLRVILKALRSNFLQESKEF